MSGRRPDTRHATCYRPASTHPDLHANAFIAVDGRAVVTVHHGGDRPVAGPLVAWTHDSRQGWVRAGEPDENDKPQELPTGTVIPGEVAVFASMLRRR